MMDPTHPRAPRWAELTATFCGIGRIKPGPGTWASAATVGLWAILASFLPTSARWPVALCCALLITLAGIAAANSVVRATGVKDPQIVVIDEVAGQLIALIAAPLSWQCLLAGLILFRAFDILKPPPIRQLEALPEGWGVMLDDVAAGALAFLVLQALVHFHVLR
jgi:phosphatidylglycerophosphatase A